MNLAATGEGGLSGAVICLNSQPVICAWGNYEQWGANLTSTVMCIRAHENVHLMAAIKGQSCNCKADYTIAHPEPPKGMDDPNAQAIFEASDREECQALRAGLNCLKKIWPSECDRIRKSWTFGEDNYDACIGEFTDHFEIIQQQLKRRQCERWFRVRLPDF
jgi:hypothetical protein